VTEVPEASNFFAHVTTKTSLDAVADHYRAAGWRVRKCSWTDFEATSEIGELVLEGEPILIHGPIADPITNAATVTKPLRDAAIAFSYECYAADRSLLLQERWTPEPHS